MQTYIGLEGKEIIIFGYHQPKTATVLVTLYTENDSLK